MVVIPEKLHATHSHEHLPTKDRVAVLLMGYGEVESYEDFANYNEQALNLLTAKFAPVPTWIYPPLAKLLALFDRHEWGHTHHDFISPHNAIFERQRAGIEHELQHEWGSGVKVFKAFNFCAPFLPNQVLAEIKNQGFSKLLIYPLLVVDSIFTSGIAIEQVNNALVELADGDEHWIKAQKYIPSFYNEPKYIDLMAHLVEEKIHTDLSTGYLPSQIGIILMNHGCPHKAKGFTSGIDESQAMYELVRNKLINNYPLISVGWLNHDTPLIEWTQPNATIEHYLEKKQPQGSKSKELEHKDVLTDSMVYSDANYQARDRQITPEIQIQRLTTQLTAAYHRIAALEEQLLRQRIS
ncbi:ferrochelatase [Dolichospermum circinale CS-537/03]|uniref:ferrochelatase n=1 Tax=Dolichospermum circinale TaxID=109265 RepID=UPI00232E2793|nr:ferrochelatase [Dolichospermum circinale]MDB9479193.1 ferrochelatase [Dolichospermum circinale CS-537/03]